MRYWLGGRDSWSSDVAILGVCCTWRKLMMTTGRNRERWPHFVYLGDSRVEYNTERDEKRWEIIRRKWDLGEFHVRVNIPIPNTLIWPLIPPVITPIQHIPIPIRQVIPLIFQIRLSPSYHSHLRPPFLFLILNFTIIAAIKLKSSLSISPGHDHEIILSTTASTPDWLFSVHSHDYELTSECSLSFWHGSLQDWPPPTTFSWWLKGEVTSSQPEGCEIPKWRIDSQQLARLPSTPCKYSSNLDSIMAFKYIPKPTPSRLWSASLWSVVHSLAVYLQNRSLMTPKITWWRSCQLYLQTWSIMASEGISKFTWSQPPNVSSTRLTQHRRVHCWFHPIMAFESISILDQSWHLSACPSSLNYGH